MHRLADNQVVDAGTLEGFTADQLMEPVGPVWEAWDSWTNPSYGDGFLLEQVFDTTTSGWVVVTAKASFGSTLASPFDSFSCALTDGTDPTVAFIGSWSYATVS